MRDLDGDIDAYAPLRNGPQDRYTIAAYAPAGSGSAISMHPPAIVVQARVPGVRYLIRGPKGGSLDLRTVKGSINVADFDGIVNAHTADGDIHMLIPQYGNASTGSGNVSVIFGSTTWPGTLHFRARDGDVEIYLNARASARVHLHTDDGTIFTDFPLKGTSSGKSETIDAPVNGGARHGIDVEVVKGSIRLLRLTPQI